jgi:hypothetical protein
MNCEHERHHGGGAMGPRGRGHHHHGAHGPQPRGHRHGGSGACGCARGSGQPFHFQRRFQTKEEKIARLETYLESLRLEAKAVEERLAELKEGE